MNAWTEKGLCHNNPNWANNMKGMPPSRVRYSVITEVIYLRSEDLDYVEHCFARHGVEVCKKFDLHFFPNREAAHLFGNV